MPVFFFLHVTPLQSHPFPPFRRRLNFPFPRICAASINFRALNTSSQVFITSLPLFFLYVLEYLIVPIYSFLFPLPCMGQGSVTLSPVVTFRCLGRMLNLCKRKFTNFRKKKFVNSVPGGVGVIFSPLLQVLPPLLRLLPRLAVGVTVALLLLLLLLLLLSVPASLLMLFLFVLPDIVVIFVGAPCGINTFFVSFRSMC